MANRYSTKDRKAIAERKAWAEEFDRCFVCGRKSEYWPLHTHEIRRRSETNEPFHPANLARLCDACHSEAHGGHVTAEVLAVLKERHDPERFDYEWLNSHGLKRLLWRPT